MSLNFIKRFIRKRLEDGSLIPFIISNILWIAEQTKLPSEYLDQIQEGFCAYNEKTLVNSETFFDYSEEKLA